MVGNQKLYIVLSGTMSSACAPRKRRNMLGSSNSCRLDGGQFLEVRRGGNVSLALSLDAYFLFILVFFLLALVYHIERPGGLVLDVVAALIILVS